MIAAPGQPARIFILERCRLFCQSMATLLRVQGGLRLVGSSADAGEFAATARAEAVDVLLLDAVARPADAVRLTRDIREELPGVSVVVVGVADRADAILEFLEAGASGYVPARASFAELVHTLESVSRGRAVCPPHVVSAVCARIRELASARAGRPGSDPEPLSPREREVLRLVARGRLNKEIAAELKISLCTVKNHVHHILRKLKVSRRKGVARLKAVEALLG
jgi:DNA-binding NarL/FixJ family response regulator